MTVAAFVNGEPRRVEIELEAEDYDAAIEAHREKLPIVCTGTLQREGRRLFKAAGLPIGRNGGLTWHDLRHEYVSHLIDRDVKSTVAQKLARHADLSTTMLYYEAHEAELVEAAKKMALGRGAG